MTKESSLSSFRRAGADFVQKVSKDKASIKFLCKHVDTSAFISGMGSFFLYAFLFSPSQPLVMNSILSGAVAFGLSGTTLMLFRGAVSIAIKQRDAERNNPSAPATPVSAHPGS